ncbi:MAG TPA: RNA polymerase sigma factor [Steroidobacteraceae bacterium]|nr:RNA polymerase sigma factor [Steroidobacteraceae bacterium]
MGKLGEIEVAAASIESAQRGDEAAQRVLYTALAPATFALIHRLVGVRAVAEDVFQDTMISVYQHLDTFRGEAPLGAWVRQIALSKCLMYLRSPWHRARLDMGAWMDDALPGASPSTLPSPESFDIERALECLSPTARAVIWLFEVEGYSHQEIAQAFGRSVSFSKSQLARAHERLREWFEPQRERQPCTPV